jgi:photosystem II stability/assembly factor-like uncharacterized protein
LSTDNGKTFSKKEDTLLKKDPTKGAMWGRGYMRALSVDKNNPNYMVCGIDGSIGGIFESKDSGNTWSKLPNQPANTTMFYGLQIDPTDSKRIFWGALKKDGGVYRSNDGGDSWEHVFKDDVMIFNLIVTDDGTIYAAGQNIWQSKDHGDTWKKLLVWAKSKGFKE